MVVDEEEDEKGGGDTQHCEIAHYTTSPLPLGLVETIFVQFLIRKMLIPPSPMYQCVGGGTHTVARCKRVN